MRDTNRLKDRYELSLDNSQVVSLTMAGIVVVGAVFILGVVVGKKFSAEAPVVASTDMLSAIDQKTDVVREAQANATDASFTFQEELTKKTPSVPALVAPVADHKKETAVAEPVEKPAKEEKKKHEEKAKSAELAPVVADDSSVKAAETVKAEPVVTRTTPVAKETPSLKEAIAKATRPTETSENGQFTLQLSASQDKSDAERFAANLRDKGYAPFIVEATVTGKGTWYRVRMGRFSTKEAASRYLNDFHRETKVAAFVTTSN